ncbi:ubiquinol-cytochrome C chaperone family protein [Paraurantiacibacter namhicola]|uniref:Ubiquinol-cytochrome C chaperone n=1 Tax=Paraurantiacibacter namhicola TaxID=645517 RepID=A0A1C7D6V2_9SPHN|nr:ubiquinol-cytochrome C chaperone family protein [Paraurantiacibacter namhicola]ANU07185.1 Ubiquinol-cytochrome C chaperone [Paraurantiacibacter namhicola]
MQHIWRPMSFFSRLFRPKADAREALRPLWHRIVETSREERWYAQHGVADTVAGRFDMIATILCLVLLRMEQDEELVAPSVLLTELFVDDMDGQLRESGINDVVVGKHIGKLMATLGGRLGAFRDGLASDKATGLEEAVRRNVSLANEAQATSLAEALRAYADHLSSLGGDAILAGQV